MDGEGSKATALDRIVERSVKHAVFGGEVGRRKFIQQVGAGTAAAALASAFPIERAKALAQEFPLTTDPFKYRLMELVGVYGDALRERCQELFGDGILSAIDCVVKLEKKGERGVLTIDAKFLHYKEY
jgi:cyanate lyase